MNKTKILIVEDESIIALNLKETLIEYVNLLIKQQLTIGCMYPSDEDIWKNNISYKRLRKKLNKKRR